MRLGVDAGGTSTRAVLVDDTGRCLGFGTAGGGNPVSWGPVRAGRAIAAAVAAALQQAGSGASAAAGGSVGGPLVLAMAGASAYSTAGAIESELRSLGLDGPVTFASDLLATFCAGTSEVDGYAVVAGTGAAAIRVRDGGVDASADGLGWLLGDAGSGFWIGHRVVRSALAALDARGPATVLTGMVLDELGIVGDGRQDSSGRTATLQAAVDELYRRQPVELSRFAALAFRAAGIGGDGDPGGGPDPGAVGATGADRVAESILAAAQDRLVKALEAVRRADTMGAVVLGGGIARRLPGLAVAIADSFSADASRDAAGGDPVAAGTGAVRVMTVPDGVVGAAVLALRRSGISVDRLVFDRLAASVSQCRRSRR